MAVVKFDLDKFLSVVSIVGPLVLMNVPGGQNIAVLLPTIINGIKEAEAIAGATGPEKKAHVMALVADAVTVANATGRIHIDVAEVQGVVSNGIDVVIGVINVIQGAKVVKDPNV